MRDTRIVLEVARWEFRRFFKLRQQVISLVLTLAISVAGYAAVQWLSRSAVVASVAVLGAPAEFPLVGQTPAADAPPPLAGVRLVAAPGRDEQALRRDVESGTIDGGLVFVDADSARLVVRGTPRWVASLEAAVSGWRRQQRFQAAGVEPALLRTLSAPVRLTVERLGESRAATRAARVSAVIAGALMMMGIWVGLAYMFVGITGEKQARVTEQVLTAISAEAWMDGKILGLSAVAAASTAGYVVSGLLLATAARFAGIAVPLPTAIGTPFALAVIVLLALLGFAFWNTFIAAIAALVNDPHSSSRGGFIMLPLLPVVIAMVAVSQPDSVPMRVLSMFPPTASPVMLTRLVVGNVAWWELAVSIPLLVAGVWALRVVAVRVFRTSLLMYGKEATWAEVWRWVRTGA